MLQPSNTASDTAVVAPCHPNAMLSSVSPDAKAKESIGRNRCFSTAVQVD